MESSNSGKKKNMQDGGALGAPGLSLHGLPPGPPSPRCRPLQRGAGAGAARGRGRAGGRGLAAGSGPPPACGARLRDGSARLKVERPRGRRAALGPRVAGRLLLQEFGLGLSLTLKRASRSADFTFRRCSCAAVTGGGSVWLCICWCSFRMQRAAK